MALGGLALAGANRGMGGEISPDGEDGVLYALEVQSLNLQGTELVVLSACDTGRGEIDYSDGIYGLTRAFRIAGAKNILMTLWPLEKGSGLSFFHNDFYRATLLGSREVKQGKKKDLTPFARDPICANPRGYLVRRHIFRAGAQLHHESTHLETEEGFRGDDQMVHHLDVQNTLSRSIQDQR
uniref:CHAT domain-containing protein n=1 Tax=Candidatus Kentrum sp. FW TaxID=2126338 RepID=A0A450TQT3_9GAMM|nr:MAG: CHAT domain-containing protein [Candidatus Kentron sp. FW]